MIVDDGVHLFKIHFTFIEIGVQTVFLRVHLLLGEKTLGCMHSRPLQTGLCMCVVNPQL